MKIGIIGSGEVGQTLGEGFLTEGHDVMLGSRNPSKEEVVKWGKKHSKGKTGTFAEAAAFGELLVLCTAGDGAENAVKLAGIENFSGKVVIDTTNPIDKKPPNHGVLRLSTGPNESLLEKIQHLAPKAKIVKAFNSVGSSLMYKPKLKGGKPSMFICGNDDEARETVAGILKDFGWETEDMGKANAAACIESLCVLWCIPGFVKDDWEHAFRVLRP